MLSKVLDKLGFRKAGREVDFRVGDYVTPKRIFESIPAEGTYSISHRTEDGCREKHILIDGEEWFGEIYNPCGFATSPKQWIVGSMADVFRVINFTSVDGQRMRVRRGGFCDENFRPQEDLSDYLGDSSLSCKDLNKDIANYQELMDLVPGIQTEQPKGRMGRLLHRGRVRVSKIITPACQAG